MLRALGARRLGELTGFLVMFRIVEDASPPLPEDCSESLQAFLKWCFNKDPTKRPDAEQLFEHEWLQEHSAAHKVSRAPTFIILFHADAPQAIAGAPSAGQHSVPASRQR